MKKCNDDCEHLVPTEEEQDKLGEKGLIHICKKYHKRVVHGSFHPKIIRLEECREGGE